MLNNPEKFRFKSTNSPKVFADKPTANIVDIYKKIVGGPIKVTGRTSLVKCCFHKEDTPSLALYPDTASFFCFGCQKTGDIYTLIQDVLHVSFKEALKFIKDN